MVRALKDNPSIQAVADTLNPRTQQDRKALIDHLQRPHRPNQRKYKRPKPIPQQPKAGKRRHRILDVVAKEAIVLARFGSLERGQES